MLSDVLTELNNACAKTAKVYVTIIHCHNSTSQPFSFAYESATHLYEDGLDVTAELPKESQGWCWAKQASYKQNPMYECLGRIYVASANSFTISMIAFLRFKRLCSSRMSNQLVDI